MTICKACGSLLCTRDDDCPTCETCGKRGHLRCTSSVALTPRVEPPKIETAPEVSLAWGVDLKAGRVVLEINLGAETKVRCHLTGNEVGDVCRGLVEAAMQLRAGLSKTERSSVVIAKGDEAPPIFPAPKPRPLR